MKVFWLQILTRVGPFLYQFTFSFAFVETGYYLYNICFPVVDNKDKAVFWFSIWYRSLRRCWLREAQEESSKQMPGTEE